MTVKEAIEILKRLQEPEPWDPQLNSAAYDALDMAISALEKQEGKKPHKNYKSYSAVWCDCGCYLGFERDGKKYCPNCGQKILWE